MEALEDIAESNFLLNLFVGVEKFRLVAPICPEEPSTAGVESLGTKVGRVKVIGNSLVRFYQTVLLRDVSELRFNPVQLCTGNRK